MTIYDKTQDEKIQFPVGIGIIQTETVRNFYNTSDATATSSDIVVGKTAYSRYGIINGELDLQNEKETSYQEGYEFGYDEGNEAGYVLGNEDGYNDGYNVGKIEGLEEGLANGKVLGREEIIEQQSDATITPDKVLNGFIGYGKNNERIVGESDAITTIDVGATGIQFGYSTFSEIPSYYNFDNVTNMSYMFYHCPTLKSVPLFDTARCRDMSSMFYYCSSLESIPQFDTSNVTTMSYMFYYCRKLVDVPKLDTKNCNNFQNMFAYCDSLVSVPEFDFSSFKGNTYGGAEIFGTYNYPGKLTTIGGFKDIGKAYSGGASSYKDIPLQYLSKLTRESILNVFNKVYDMNLNTAQTGTVNIKLHANVKALLSDEDIAIATNKGWTVQ